MRAVSLTLGLGVRNDKQRGGGGRLDALSLNRNNRGGWRANSRGDRGVINGRVTLTVGLELRVVV